MGNHNWRARVLPTLMMAGVVSLLLSLALGGFIFYQWVLAFEATAASLVLVVVYFLDSRRNTSKAQWPPLLPLAVIFASGGAKSFYVARPGTAMVVIAILLRRCPVRRLVVVIVRATFKVRMPKLKRNAAEKRIAIEPRFLLRQSQSTN